VTGATIETTFGADALGVRAATGNVEEQVMSDSDIKGYRSH